MISDELLKKTLENIKTPVAYNYFFENIDNPAWIVPLKEKGYFKNPIPAIRTDGYIQFPIWPESNYLLKVADKAPNEVLEIIKSLPETDNERVMDDIVKILLKVSATKAARFTPLLKKFVNMPQYLMLHSSIAELISKFAENGQVRSALSLAEDMLDLLPDPEKEEKLKSDYIMIKPAAKLRDHDYESVLEKITAPLTNAAPFETIDMYAGLLNKAIDYEQTYFKEDGDKVVFEDKKDDFSYISRPNIAEDSGHGHNPDDALTTALRDTVLLMVKRSDIEDLEKLAKLKELAMNKYSIFRRIVEFGLRDYKEAEAYSIFYKGLVSEKRLKAILESEREGMNKVTSGFVNEKPTKVLEGLSDDELLETLRTYKDESGWSFDRDSISKELSYLTKLDPKRFARLLERISNVKNEYLNEIIQAFEEAIDSLDEPSIVIVLEALLSIFMKKSVAQDKERFDYYEWSKASAIRFVEKVVGLTAAKSERVTTKSIGIVTDLILIFSRDNSTKDNDSSGLEPVDWSINSVKGQALHATAYILTWINRNKADKKYYKPIFDELDWHLDPNNDSDPSTRSVYGWRFEVFYGSDKEWTSNNIDRIFSDDKLGYAAFDAYLMFNRVHQDALVILGDVFRRQLPRLATAPPEDGKSRHDGLNSLTQHLALHYWYADIDLSKDSLMSILLEVADKKYIRELANFIGFRLYKSKDEGTQVEDGHIDKLLLLWEAIVEVTKTDKTKLAALEEFGSWFASGRFDPKWSLAQLKYAALKAGDIHLDFAALEYMETLAAQYPKESLSALSAMIDGTRERWSVSSWSKNTTSIIQSAYGSNNEDAKKQAVALANKLVAKGYTEYRNVARAIDE